MDLKYFIKLVYASEYKKILYLLRDYPEEWWIILFENSAMLASLDILVIYINTSSTDIGSNSDVRYKRVCELYLLYILLRRELKYMVFYYNYKEDEGGSWSQLGVTSLQDRDVFIKHINE